ncbi:MAG: phage terminase small subunit P27 family [Bacteroidales bacterium]|nr:phage terminase small subunit P27 family [Bacteroidales bacterium]
MARPREPIALIQAKGKKNLTKAEIAERQASEVQPCTDDIVAPSYLTGAQKKRFNKLAGQLVKIKIMGETDCEALARYVSAQELYEQAVKDLRAAQKDKPQDQSLEGLLAWANLLETLDKRQDRYFKQAQTAARDLGLTIGSRCKLQVPIKEEAPKQNKFAQFEVLKGQKEAVGND